MLIFNILKMRKKICVAKGYESAKKSLCIKLFDLYLSHQKS